MYAVFAGLQHRVHVRQDHRWTLRCGTAVDPWGVDVATGSLMDGIDVCPACSSGRAHPNARKARQALNPQTVSRPNASTGRENGPNRGGTSKAARSPAMCAACQSTVAARGQGGYCAKCAHRFLPRCSRCKKPFIQPTKAPRTTKCASCRKGDSKMSASVWAVASAGSPGLGKRA